MENKNIDSKERILETMVNLLMEEKDVNKITTRQIAELANVNSALINYYYQSKENLVYKAVEFCMENIAKKIFAEDMQNEDPPVIRLKNMLRAFSNFAFNNYYLSEIAVSNEVKHGSIGTSTTILPLLSEIFKEKKTEVDLKLIAMQIIIPMQVMFLNANEYKVYLAKDLFDEQIRNKLLDQMIDNILKGNQNDE